MTLEDWNYGTPKYQITAKQLAYYFNINSKHVGCNFTPVIERLSHRRFELEKVNTIGSREYDYVPLFEQISYQNGYLTVIPNRELKDVYLRSTEYYQNINLSVYLTLKKEYSKKLYELLCALRYTGFTSRDIGISTLKHIFGIANIFGQVREDKKSFRTTNVFMQRCIRDSLEELLCNEASLQKVDFIVIRSGRCIQSIRFKIQWKSNVCIPFSYLRSDSRFTIPVVIDSNQEALL